MRRLLFALAIAAPLCMIAACAQIGPSAFEGAETRRVSNIAAKAPVADAMILFFWERHLKGPATGIVTLCDNAEVVRTDSNGYYTAPRWKGDLGRQRGIYKRGLTVVHRSTRDSPIDELVPVADAEQRLRELVTIIGSVQCGPTARRNVNDLFMSIRAESDELSRTGQGREFAEAIRRAAPVSGDVVQPVHPGPQYEGL